MPNKLTIVLSGKKQSGKNTSCNYILARFLNLKLRKNIFTVSSTGDLVEGDTVVTSKFIEDYGGKVYSFADPLKRFCIDVLGVPYEACYGTDEQKNSLIEHIKWENFPIKEIAVGRHGPMSGRDIMQFFGTEVVRKWYADAWARGTYSSIVREGFELALVCDARFPNEITMGTMVDAKTVRLLRSIASDPHPSEIALDDFPLSGYSFVSDNRYMSLTESCQNLDTILPFWFEERNII